MADIIFVHGWGFDNNIWNEISNEEFFDNHNIHQINLGYIGDKNIEQKFENPIVIAHSLGVMWAIENIKNINKIISFCGFSAFGKFLGQPILTNMKTKLIENIDDEMKQFYQNCGTNYTNPKFNIDELFNGFELLEKLDTYEKLLNLNSKNIFPFISKNDKIVPFRMSMKIWKNYNPVIFEGQSDHMLPFKNKNWSIEQIKKIIND